MGKKAVKSTRKFAASGQLKKTIQARKKHQEIRRKTQGKKGGRKDVKGKQPQAAAAADGEEDEEETASPPRSGKGKLKGKSVDDFLNGDFMDEDDGEDVDVVDAIEESDEDDGEGDDEDEDDNQSFASVDDLDGEGEAHLLELSKLAERDPEFYKYLQENDRELLDFDLDNAAADDDDELEDIDGDAEMADERAPALTKEQLRKWQKALLEHRSLRALRRLLIAFRAAAHMNEENQHVAWSIESASVYSKLVTTALRYTPVVLEHHVPYKTLPNGKFKAPIQTPKQRTLSKLILSFFHNIIHIIEQLTEPSMVQLAVSESARLLPYVMTSRKAIKQYLKVCLQLWSSGEDSIRIAAILAIRRLVSSTDESIMDNVLKSTYLTLVRSSKTTTAHTVPAITLMKNSASEIYCLDHATSYQHAFGYIRQLAIHLRNSMKVKTKEAYKQVYNWQYVHSIDFWSLVLARACDTQAELEKGGVESELKALIYPLAQVTLGAIKLISAPRSYPFHFHLIRSLLHLTHHTRVYIPLSPYLLPIVTSTLSPTTAKKSSTLKPLDLETNIRAPQQYLRTRVYAEALAEEGCLLLAEWLASAPVQGSIAFPEIIVPVVIALRRAIKGARNAGAGGKGKGRAGAVKEAGTAKALVERVEESARWVEQRRKDVAFAPGQLEEVRRWEEGVNVEETPLGKYVKVQRRAKEKQRKLMEKARKGEREMLEE